MNAQMSPIPRTAALLAALLCAATLNAAPDPAQYPLRLHVLTTTPHTRIPTRFQGVAGGGAAMGEVDAGAMSSGGSALAQGSTFGDQDPVFFGNGRADLVAPALTQGLNFIYDDCPARVRISLRLQPLVARWKTPNKQLEVLVPTEDIPSLHHEPVDKFTRCTLSVTLQKTVYLRSRKGGLVQVSIADYAKRPALRGFIQGPVPTLLKRTPPNPPATPTPAASIPASRP